MTVLKKIIKKKILNLSTVLYYIRTKKKCVCDKIKAFFFRHSEKNFKIISCNIWVNYRKARVLYDQKVLTYIIQEINI